MGHDTTAKIMDACGRRLDYLRISLTDRCNFRCAYCMPPEGIPLLPREDILRLDEFEHLARLFASMGVRKIRLTGGEPLLRKKIVTLVHALAHVEGIEEVCLTTNGSLLAPLAHSLKESGLSGVNISLDSLKRERFNRITRSQAFDTVIAGIEAAVRAKLPVKLNVVALSDLCREEVLEFCKLAALWAVEVRFIEFMPLCGTAWQSTQGLSMSILRTWIEDQISLKPSASPSQVAECYDMEGTRGRVGFIASLSHPFCGTCNRIRLSATGALRSCLFSNHTVDLRTLLRNHTPDDDIEFLIRQALWLKPKGHEEIRRQVEDIQLPTIRSIGG